MPTLRCTTRQGLVDNIRKYRIFVDGVEAGQIREGEALHLPITLGRHVVEAKIKIGVESASPFRRRVGE